MHLSITNASLKRLIQHLLGPSTFLLMIILLLVLYYWVDLNVLVFFHDSTLKNYTLIFNCITLLGDGLIGIFFLFGGLWFRYIVRRPLWERRAWFIVQCVTLSSVVCWILKIICGRARPFLWFETHAYGFSGLTMKPNHWSFPSGHTTTSFSILFALSLMFPRYWIVFIIPGLFVAFSRLVLEYHYLSDVCFATYSALLEVTLLAYFLRKKTPLQLVY